MSNASLPSADPHSAKPKPLQLIQDLLKKKTQSAKMSVPYQQPAKQISVGSSDMPSTIYLENHKNGVTTLLMQRHCFLAIIRNDKDSALTIKETFFPLKGIPTTMAIRFSAATLDIESYEHTLPGRTIVLNVDNSSGTPPTLIDMSDWKAKDFVKAKLILSKLKIGDISKIRIVVDDVSRFGKKWDDREVKWFLTRKVTPYQLAHVVLPPPPGYKSSSSSPVDTQSDASVANSSMPATGSTGSADDTFTPAPTTATPTPTVTTAAETEPATYVPTITTTTIVPFHPTKPKPATFLISTRRALRLAKDTLADLQEDLQGEVVVDFKEAFAKAKAGIVGKEGEEDGIEERVLRFDMAQRKLFRVTALVQKEELYREVIIPSLEGRVKRYEDKVKEEEKAKEELIEF